jgi:hypothetical protein
MTFDNVTGHWTASLDTATLSDGLHVLTIKAKDKAGNIRKTSIAVTIDNTGPSANISTPSNNSYVHGATEINVMGQDANFNRTELYIDGRLVATSNVNGTNTYLWNTTTLTDGAYLIAIKVYDNANNFSTDEISVTADNTLPIVDIITPTASANVGGNCTITVSAFDSNLDYMQLSVDGHNLTSWNTNGIHSYIWNTNSINGMQTISLSVYDKTGTKTEKTVTVIVDNASPSVAISAPSTGAVLSGIVSVNFTASDTNLRSLQLLIDQNVYNATGSTTYQWDTTKVGDGTYIIKLLAYDRAGNIGETSVSVSTINSKLNTEANKNLYLAIGTPLGFMIGILVAYAILKRKK